jgi:hypothetical protein
MDDRLSKEARERNSKLESLESRLQDGILMGKMGVLEAIEEMRGVLQPQPQQQYNAQGRRSPPIVARSTSPHNRQRGASANNLRSSTGEQARSLSLSPLSPLSSPFSSLFFSHFSPLLVSSLLFSSRLVSSLLFSSCLFSSSLLLFSSRLVSSLLSSPHPFARIFHFSSLFLSLDTLLLPSLSLTTNTIPSRSAASSLAVATHALRWKAHALRRKAPSGFPARRPFALEQDQDGRPQQSHSARDG